MDFKPAKKLGFGLMRLPLTDPNVETSIDIEEMKRMVDAFLAGGFTYFDTAWMYCGFQSECAAKQALVDRYPRESYTLADKLHSAYIKTKADRDKIFNEQLRKTGAGYFDYYLIHDVNAEHYKVYQELECFEWLAEKKAAGLVRHMGFSFHDNAELLDRVLTDHPEVEFVQLQLNYLDWDSETVQSGKCYQTAVRHGKPVIVMEPVKGGTLAKVPAGVEAMFKQARPELSVPSWAIRFAASLDNVMVVLSGMSDLAQMRDNMSYMAALEPLSEAEQALVRRAAAAIRGGIAIPCTGCSYCTEGCPKHIAIPKYFALYNAALQADDKAPQTQSYAALAREFGKASDCIACRQCEHVCPQHLPIPQHLKDVAQYFEG